MVNVNHVGKVPEHIERIRQSWKYRAVAALRGSQTPAGRILLAVLGKAPSNSARWISGANIDKDGRLIAYWQDGPGCPPRLEIVCDVRMYCEAFWHLADKLKFTDAEREELFRELRFWINEDAREAELLQKT